MAKTRDILLAGTMVPALLLSTPGLAAVAGAAVLVAQASPDQDPRKQKGGGASPFSARPPAEARPEAAPQAPRPAPAQRAPEAPPAPRAQAPQQAPRPANGSSFGGNPAPAQQQQLRPAQAAPRPIAPQAAPRPQAPAAQVAPAARPPAPAPAPDRVQAPAPRPPAPAAPAAQQARPFGQPLPTPPAAKAVPNAPAAVQRPAQAAPGTPSPGIAPAQQLRPGVAPGAPAAQPPAQGQQARPLGQPLPTPPRAGTAPNAFGQQPRTTITGPASPATRPAQGQQVRPLGQPLPTPPAAGTAPNAFGQQRPVNTGPATPAPQPGAQGQQARPLGQPLPTPPAAGTAPNAFSQQRPANTGPATPAPQPGVQGQQARPLGQPLPTPPAAGTAPNPFGQQQPTNTGPATPAPQPGAQGQQARPPGQPLPTPPAANAAPGQPVTAGGQPGRTGVVLPPVQEAQPGQPQRRGPSAGGAVAAGAAAGFVGGFLASQSLNSLQDVQGRRQRYDDEGATIYREPGRTIIEDPQNRYFIAHDENERFRDLGYDVRDNREGDQYVARYTGRDGSEITTYTDDNGQLVRRMRRFPDGRTVVLIDNGPAGPARAVDQEIVELPPPPLQIPQDRYVVESEAADEGVIYDTLAAPPVAPIQQRYTLNQVRYSPDLRARMRSVDVDTVTFPSGSWTVSPEQAGRLDAIARAINQAIGRNPQEVFLVEGYTDAVGAPVDNLSLSDRRAQAVATLLTQQFQVPPENLTTQGYGAQYLKVQTQGAEAANRRVTVRRITPLLAGNGQQQ